MYVFKLNYNARPSVRRFVDLLQILPLMDSRKRLHEIHEEHPKVAQNRLSSSALDQMPQRSPQCEIHLLLEKCNCG